MAIQKITMPTIKIPTITYLVILHIDFTLLLYLFRFLIDYFDQHDKSSTQYHNSAKKLSHCEKIPYRGQPGIWFPHKFNTKSYY